MTFTRSMEEVRNEITAQALERHRGDFASMQEYIDKELEAFRKFQESDLSEVAEVRKPLVECAFRMGESWSERLEHLREALADYRTFKEFKDERLTAEELDSLKIKIASLSKHQSSQSPALWIHQLETECDRLHKANTYRKYADVIVELEAIVGSHFNNEASGDFRYPITFYDSRGKKLTRRSTMKDISPDVAVVGHYQLGANALMIVQALMDVVERLETKFGLDIGSSSEGGNTPEDAIGRT